METQYPDIMVDIETTGTHPEHNAIIQIAAVRFNLQEGTVDSSDMFDRCLAMAPNRYWDEDTRHWWHGKNFKVYQGIAARMEEPGPVLKVFSDWLNAKPCGEPLRFWAKPTSFDYSFMQSYFRQFNIHFPCHYRYARDMNSFLAGLAKGPMPENLDVPFAGDAHNALHDVLHQIKTVFTAMDHQ